MLARQTNKLGKPLEPLRYWGKIGRAYLGFLWMYVSFNRKKSPLNKTWRALLRVHVSQKLHCPFCIDMNMADALKLGLSHAKLDALSDYKQNNLFSGDEKKLLSYAEAVITSDQNACATLQSELKKILSDEGVIELTALIAHQAMSALFNSALGIEPHGFCGV